MATATLSHLTDKSAQGRFIGILIAGEFFDLARLGNPSQILAFQHALDDARKRYGHALCKCRGSPLKLQVRLREGKYHLAVWPEEGHLHDSNCMFFRDIGQAPVPVETRGGLQIADGTKGIELSFSFFRTTHPGASGSQQPRIEPTSARNEQPDQLNLRTLLNVLWAEASLNRWHPKWNRDWGRARYELAQAADRISVHGEPLSRHMFIPRPYRETARDELNRELERFVAALAVPTGGQVKSGLLIAPLRRITDLEGGSKALHMRHLHKPIGINAAVFDFLNRNCRTPLRRVLQASEPAAPRPAGWVEVRQPETIAFLHVETTSRGGLWARSAWIMPTHPTVFIPANNTDEILLIDALIQGHYQFSRNLFAEQASLRTAPDWILRHVLDPDGRPVPRAALDILPKGAAPEYVRARSALADALAGQGVPRWAWTPAGKQVDRRVPPLPPLDDGDQVNAKVTLGRLRAHLDVSYAYGSGQQSHNPSTGESHE